jgi:hypothetical protein
VKAPELQNPSVKAPELRIPTPCRKSLRFIYFLQAQKTFCFCCSINFLHLSSFIWFKKIKTLLLQIYFHSKKNLFCVFIFLLWKITAVKIWHKNMKMRERKIVNGGEKMYFFIFHLLWFFLLFFVEFFCYFRSFGEYFIHNPVLEFVWFTEIKEITWIRLWEVTELMQTQKNM